MDYSMEVSALGDRISIGEEAHVITLGVSTGFPAGSTAGITPEILRKLVEGLR